MHKRGAWWSSGLTHYVETMPRIEGSKQPVSSSFSNIPQANSSEERRQGTGYPSPREERRTKTDRQRVVSKVERSNYKGRWFGFESLIKWSTPSSEECWWEKTTQLSHEFRTPKHIKNVTPKKKKSTAAGSKKKLLLCSSEIDIERKTLFD